MAHNNTPQIDRRQAVKQTVTMFGAMALGARSAFAATEPLLRFTAIDHINLAVADPAKSAAFYSRIFGHDVWKAKKGSAFFVKTGPNYLALTAVGSGPKAKVETYYGVAVEGFQASEIKHTLEQAGIA